MKSVEQCLSELKKAIQTEKWNSCKSTDDLRCEQIENLIKEIEEKDKIINCYKSRYGELKQC